MDLMLQKPWIYLIFLFESVSAFGEEGKIVLCVFIPIIGFLLFLVLAQRVWHWYRQKMMEPVVYDPYLDKMVQDIYPPRMAPPWSTGQIVSFVPQADHSSVLKRQGSMPHHDTALDSPCSPTPLLRPLLQIKPALKTTQKVRRSTEVGSTQRRSSNFSLQPVPVFSSKSDLCKKMVSMDVLFKDESGHMVVQPGTISDLTKGLTFILWGKSDCLDNSKYPQNPYGKSNTQNNAAVSPPVMSKLFKEKTQLGQLLRTKKHKKEYGRNIEMDLQLEDDNNLTSRELQQHVKISEQFMSRSVHSLCHNINSALVVPGEIIETFGASANGTNEETTMSIQSCLKGAREKKRRKQIVRFDKECIRNLKRERQQRKKNDKVKGDLVDENTYDCPTGFHDTAGTLEPIDGDMIVNVSPLSVDTATSPNLLPTKDMEHNLLPAFTTNKKGSISDISTYPIKFREIKSNSYIDLKSPTLYGTINDVMTANTDMAKWSYMEDAWKYSAQGVNHDAASENPTQSAQEKNHSLSSVLVEAVVHHASSESMTEHENVETKSWMRNTPRNMKATSHDFSSINSLQRFYSDASYHHAFEYLPNVSPQSLNTERGRVMPANKDRTDSFCESLQISFSSPVCDIAHSLDIPSCEPLGHSKTNDDMEEVFISQSYSQTKVNDKASQKCKSLPIMYRSNECHSSNVFKDTPDVLPCKAGSDNDMAVRDDGCDSVNKGSVSHSFTFPRDMTQLRSPSVANIERLTSNFSNVSNISFVTARESVTSDVFSLI